MNFIDFFSGIGGSTIALINSGWKLLDAVEIEDSGRKIYKQNFKLLPKRDITNIEVHKLKSADLFFASLPLKYQSKVATTINSYEKLQTFNYNYFFDFVSYYNPRYVIIETLATIEKKTLRSICYLLNRKNNYKFRIIHRNIKDYGLPLSKQGLYIIGTKKEEEKIKLHREVQKKETSIYDFWQDFIPYNSTLEKDDYILIEPKESNNGGILRGYLAKRKIKMMEDSSIYHRIFSDEGLFPYFLSSEKNYRYYVYSERKEIVYRLSVEQCFAMAGFSSAFDLGNISQRKSSLLLGQSSIIPAVEEIGKAILLAENFRN